MKKAVSLITGVGIGGGLMYFLDPDKGKRRRVRVRDKVVHAVHETRDAVGKASRDLAHRTQGVLAAVDTLVSYERPDDTLLVARLRSKLGRIVSHPKAIKIEAKDGRITLGGPILASEVENLLRTVSAESGVHEVINNLETHESAENVPGLQGGHAKTGETGELTRAYWAPATRVLAGAAGAALALYGARRRGLVGSTAGTLGFGLLSRALTNTRLLGLVSGSRWPIHIQKTINIAAPVEEVFEFWTHHENFPQFMSHVREVRPIGEGRYHWVVGGPAGVTAEWEAEITSLVKNQSLSWRSLPGSAIGQSGTVHFKAVSEGETCVEVSMAYNPPAGAIGHTIARLLSADPKAQMDADLMRLKAYIETGRVPHDAARKESAASGTRVH